MRKDFFEKCPHCGSNAGLYVKFEAYEFLNYDGTPAGYSDDYTRKGKTCYCIKCDRPVCRYSTYLKYER